MVEHGRRSCPRQKTHMEYDVYDSGYGFGFFHACLDVSCGGEVYLDSPGKMRIRMVRYIHQEGRNYTSGRTVLFNVNL